MRFTAPVIVFLVNCFCMITLVSTAASKFFLNDIEEGGILLLLLPLALISLAVKAIFAFTKIETAEDEDVYDIVLFYEMFLLAGKFMIPVVIIQFMKLPNVVGCLFYLSDVVASLLTIILSYKAHGSHAQISV